MTSPLSAPQNASTGQPKRIVRGQDRMLGGVASGIADYFQVDVSAVRLLFVLVALLPGPAFIAYLLAWIVLPEAGTITDVPFQAPGRAAGADTGVVKP